MARLELALLGPFQVTLDEQPVTSFAYEKVRALLAYLALEADYPHHRDTLAAILWSEQSNKHARSNLRKALATLRQALGDRTSESPFFSTTRHTIQFNGTRDCSLDVRLFTNYLDPRTKHQHPVGELCAECVAQLEKAVALYRGEFLSNLSVHDSVTFEEWVGLTRERLHVQVVNACTQLSTYYECQRHWDQARQYAEKQIVLEPWNETAYQCLMRVFAYTGQRSTALRQYERCRKILAAELAIEPEVRTTMLYEQIRGGKFAPLLYTPTMQPHAKGVTSTNLL